MVLCTEVGDPKEGAVWGQRKRDELEIQGGREGCGLQVVVSCMHADWKLRREVWA